MDFLTIGFVCICAVTCIAVCACAYYLTEIRKAEIQQQGITSRAQAKLVSETVPAQAEWWQTLAGEAMKNPEIVRIISPYIPALADKFGLKKT